MSNEQENELTPGQQADQDELKRRAYREAEANAARDAEIARRTDAQQTPQDNPSGIEAVSTDGNQTLEAQAENVHAEGDQEVAPVQPDQPDPQPAEGTEYVPAPNPANPDQQ